MARIVDDGVAVNAVRISNNRAIPSIVFFDTIASTDLTNPFQAAAEPSHIGLALLVERIVEVDVPIAHRAVFICGVRRLQQHLLGQHQTQMQR